MPHWQLGILALVQAISEFLPISSSGHLGLLQSLFDLTPSLSLAVFLNTATLFSVIFVFRYQIRHFFKSLPLIIIGSLPAAIIGLTCKDQIGSIFSQPQYLSLFFFITSILLLSLKFIQVKDLSLTPLKALIIGFFQALALFPGVSRSGATIFSALLLGLSATTAFQFSFYLFIPASLGALLLNFDQINTLSSFQLLPGLTSFLIAFLVGIFCLHLLRRLLTNHHLWLFGFYTLFLASLVFFFTQQ